MKRLLLPLLAALALPTAVQAESRKEFKPASKSEINLYRQTAVSDFCLSRQSRISFSNSIRTAARKYTLAVTQKHKGLIEEIKNTTLPRAQIFRGAYIQTLYGAIQTCPNSVPNHEIRKLEFTLKRLNQLK